MPQAMMEYRCRRCGRVFAIEIADNEDVVRQRLRERAAQGNTHELHQCESQPLPGQGVGDLLGYSVVEGEATGAPF
jgi:hypothetical protein